MIILKSPHIPRGLGLPQLSTFLQLLSVLKGKKKKLMLFCLTSWRLRKHLASSVIRPDRLQRRLVSASGTLQLIAVRKPSEAECKNTPPLSHILQKHKTLCVYSAWTPHGLRRARTREGSWNLSSLASHKSASDFAVLLEFSFCTVSFGLGGRWE